MISDLEFWRLMEMKIRADAGERRANLGNGAAQDYAQYREAVGYIRAHKRTLEIAREVYGQMMGTAPEPVPEEFEVDDGFPI